MPENQKIIAGREKLKILYRFSNFEIIYKKFEFKVQNVMHKFVFSTNFFY